MKEVHYHYATLPYRTTLLRLLRQSPSYCANRPGKRANVVLYDGGGTETRTLKVGLKVRYDYQFHHTPMGLPLLSLDMTVSPLKNLFGAPGWNRTIDTVLPRLCLAIGLQEHGRGYRSRTRTSGIKIRCATITPIPNCYFGAESRNRTSFYCSSGSRWNDHTSSLGIGAS